MKRLVSILLLLVATCTTNPTTGRSQLLMYSEEQMVKLGEQAYIEMTVKDKKVTIVTDRRLVDPLLRVGRSLAAAAEKPEYKWEFKLIDAPKTANAWALPGGKIAFYTGLYPIVEDEAGMAIVMGHEIMHAILRHSNERMSQQQVTAAAVTAAAIGVGLSDAKYKGAIIGAMGAGAALGIILPYSRKHESEADEFGLYLAAKAGYDPEAGIRVWKRMAEESKSRPPEFLSTHPDPLNRAEKMREWMPEAKGLYAKSSKKTNRKLPAVK
ncbi:MAG: M48 family metallopeptidase [Planctomycetota bacterium]|jgi:predicted Zn-dependent protease